MSVELQDTSLVYVGSVKKVWSLPSEVDSLLFEYTDDYSVFDWGKMPDTIANKGRALAIMGAYFFDRLGSAEYWRELQKSPSLKRLDSAWLADKFSLPIFEDLCKHGAPTHHKGLVISAGQTRNYKDAAHSQSGVYLEVRPAEVNHPEPFTLINQTVYHYSRKPSLAPRRLVPLEVVFRFGMPSGSSLKGRLDKDPGYAAKLGLTSVPKQGEFFERPVIEFFTKLEPKDRLLTLQEALLISGLEPHDFEQLVNLSYLLALGLYGLFAEKGIELWDGKFEFIYGRDGLQLADSIGPDELRLIYKDCHLSKEMIRQVYRGSDWENALKEAQASGKPDWKDICLRAGKEPERLPADFKNIVDQLYGALTNHLLGEEIFPDQPKLDEYVQSVKNYEKKTTAK